MEMNIEKYRALADERIKTTIAIPYYLAILF